MQRRTASSVGVIGSDRRQLVLGVTGAFEVGCGRQPTGASHQSVWSWKNCWTAISEHSLSSIDAHSTLPP